MSVQVYLAAGTRTPIGRFLGDLAGWSAPELAGFCIREAVQRSGLSSVDIDEIILGNVLGAGLGQAPAKQASIYGGLGAAIGCATVNKVCGSGLYSVMLGTRSIRAGDSQIVVAGGMESMSNAPHLLRGARSGWKYGAQPMLDHIEWDGLRCPHGSALMGIYAERVASHHHVSRSDQDAWSLLSHQRASAAVQQGKFRSEIVPITDAKGNVFRDDTGPRADASLDKLSRLKPAFVDSGTVTAGNASTLSDGAACVILASESHRERLRCSHLFKIVGSSVYAQAPEDLFSAPVGAVKRLLADRGKQVRDVGLFEINEAFASQTVHCQRDLGLDPERLNVHGGAIAIGHPIGCSGARVLVTLMHALVDRKEEFGVAALCLGGGEAVAMMIQRVQ
jgi:acetyl-CoA C-acetyltransferase